MSACCPPAEAVAPRLEPVAGDRRVRAVYAVEGLHCAGCIRRIENALEALPGIASARVNYTLNRVAVEGSASAVAPETIAPALSAIGYVATPFEARAADAAADRDMKRLLVALAVAGFAAMNIMLLSVSVWAGNASDITPETRDLFHWISAAIAFPAAAIAGRPFYESAVRALRAGRLNMDVPITIGVLMALGLSLYQTAISSDHAYYESAIMLLFFLLGGRVLEQAMRRRTRALAGNLASFRSGTADRIRDDGTLEEVAPALLGPGDRIRLKPGDRVPVDGVVTHGSASIDQSNVTGETMPVRAHAGSAVYAGAVSLDATLDIEVLAPVGETLIDTVQGLLDRATEARSRRLDLADRAARLYAPVVHTTALLAGVGWFLSGAGLEQAVVVATTVLIITCPCALALAIPAVQVAAAGAFFRAGVFLNGGGAVERLAEIDTAVFDKTGTLTLPETGHIDTAGIAPDVLERAARLAAGSRHPLAAALALHAEGAAPAVSEMRGAGVEATIDGIACRLGSPAFCGLDDTIGDDDEVSVLVYREGATAHVFRIEQRLRPGAREAIHRLRARGIAIAILSGDRPGAVAAVARQLGIDDFAGGLDPAGKIARIEALGARGKRVLMVGDGLNDAPALAAASVSISPSSAVDMARAQADAVFLGASLAPAAASIDIAVKARRLMGQNLAFAATYNAVAIPVAVLGYVTPLIAALAMSASSLIVTANALRALPSGRLNPKAPEARATAPAAVS